MIIEKIMKSNIGVMDKILRLSVVLIIGALYLLDAITGVSAMVFGAIGVYLIITSFLGMSPIYLIFNYSSVEKVRASRKKRR